MHFEITKNKVNKVQTNIDENKKIKMENSQIDRNLEIKEKSLNFNIENQENLKKLQSEIISKNLIIKGELNNFKIQNPSNLVIRRTKLGKVFCYRPISLINWTEKEDEILVESVKKNNFKNWKKISEQLPGRTALQCSTRFKRIQPSGIKGTWTAEEDEIIMTQIDLQMKLNGKIRWCQVSEHVHRLQ